MTVNSLPPTHPGNAERRGLRDNDIFAGMRLAHIWLRWGWNDIAQKYRRSKLGPFWNSLNLAVQVVAIGFVFSTLWKMDIGELMPYLCPGLILWNLLTGFVNEGCQSFSASGNIIKSINLPLSIHAYRVITRNLVLFLHNAVVYIAVVVIFGVELNLATLFLIPAFVFYIINGVWVTLLFGVLSARFRDVPQVMTNLLLLMFFVTPIFWFPNALGRSRYLADFNVIFHFIDIGRMPMMGNMPSLTSWLVVFGVTVCG
ncbi:MAG TPA: ABC transporter permease, partial [Rhodospirillaceae bacterium]|nr:ABC transporter permease [Rhodospirillaceae bacterium]